MIDRRSFLAKSSVATALAAVGIQQAGAQAPPAVLPATIEPAQSPAPIAAGGEPGEIVERFSGHWTTYDHPNRIVLGNSVELWATRTACGMTCRPAGGDDPGERIEFDDRRIVWAFTCMMRLMRIHGIRPPGVADASIGTSLGS